MQISDCGTKFAKQIYFLRLSVLFFETIKYHQKSPGFGLTAVGEMGMNEERGQLISLLSLLLVGREAVVNC